MFFFFFLFSDKNNFRIWSRKPRWLSVAADGRTLHSACQRAQPLHSRSFASFAPTDTRTRVCKQLRAGDAPTAAPQHVFPVSQSVYNSTTAGCHGGNPYELQMPRAGTNQGAAVTHHGPQVPPSATGTLLLFLPHIYCHDFAPPLGLMANTQPRHHRPLELQGTLQ